MRVVPIQADRGWLLVIILLAGCARLAVSLPRLAAPLDDPDNYLPLARSLAAGDGLQFKGRPTAYRPPLYPMVLAPLTLLGEGRSLAGAVFGLNAVLGMGTVLLSALAAQRYGFRRLQILWVSSLVAFDPILVVQARSVMTESLAAFLIALLLAVLAGSGKRAPLWGGFALGLAVLCRPSILSAGVLLGGVALVTGPGLWADRLRRGMLLGLGCLVVLAPWAYRNYRVWGEPVWTTTHGGYTLYLANNPVYYTEVLHGPPGAVWSGENQRRWFREINQGVAGLRAPQADRSFTRSAWMFILEHPHDFFWASSARLGRFWGIAPAKSVYPGTIRWLTMVWTIPFWAAVLLGLTCRSLWRWPAVSAPVLLAGLTLVHTFFWTDMRMRAPLIPALALIAGYAYRAIRFWHQTGAPSVDPGNTQAQHIQRPMETAERDATI